MSVIRSLKERLQRRIHRVRNKQVSRGAKLRISVFRSVKHIYAQIIDDAQQTTLVSFSSLHLGDKKAGDKTTVAKCVGLELGKLAMEKNLGDVFFDRGCYLYHGRVKALADGLREAGLKF